jgi:acyl-coenzyme A thioesterase PaaI-like protein
VPDDARKLSIARGFVATIPHAQRQGMFVASVHGDEVTLCLPFRDELVGNPELGVVHSGALTVLLDQALGIAGLCSDLLPPSLTPTLDLRIDHLGTAPAGRDIYACARLYRCTRRVVFAEGWAWAEKRQRPVARATGNFIRLATVEQMREMMQPGPEGGA